MLGLLAFPLTIAVYMIWESFGILLMIAGWIFDALDWFLRCIWPGKECPKVMEQVSVKVKRASHKAKRKAIEEWS